MWAACMVTRLISGREVTLPPLKPAVTSRAVTAQVKAVDHWLYETALEDARVAGNDYLETMVKSMDHDNLSPADRDMLNDMLFGDERGCNLQTGEIIR